MLFFLFGFFFFFLLLTRKYYKRHKGVKTRSSFSQKKRHKKNKRHRVFIKYNRLPFSVEKLLRSNTMDFKQKQSNQYLLIGVKQLLTIDFYFGFSVKVTSRFYHTQVHTTIISNTYVLLTVISQFADTTFCIIIS